MKNQIAKYIAKFYNLIPKDFKVTVYVVTSNFIIGILSLLIIDLQNLDLSNKYFALFIVMIVGVLTGIVNEIQKKLADRGDLVLAKEGSKTILDKYTAKAHEDLKLKTIAAKASE